jgi:RND family efflux transporter MFP subunit
MPADDLSKLKIDKTDKVASPGQRKRKKIFILAAVFIVLTLGILYIEGIIAPAVTVDVATVSLVYPSQSISKLNASGYIVAQRKAAVSSKITGRLVSMLVEEGRVVEKGQIVAQLEGDDVRASRKQAAASLNTSLAALEQAKVERDDARREYDRYKRLAAGGYVARSQFETTEARYLRAEAAVSGADASMKAAKAALQSADIAVEYTMIRAPFDGVILTKNADVGDIVTPIGAAANAKAAVVTMADMDSLQVEVDVSETNINQVSMNQPCEIQLDAIPDIRFRGEVHTLVPTVDRTKATVLVKVRFIDKDPRMLPDMSAKVSFLSRKLRTEEQKPRLAASTSSLSAKGNRITAFLVEDNHVREVPVTVGMKLGDMTEIVSGLKPGDRVVVNAPKGLQDGARIKIAEK